MKKPANEVVVGDRVWFSGSVWTVNKIEGNKIYGVGGFSLFGAVPMDAPGVNLFNKGTHQVTIVTERNSRYHILEQNEAGDWLDGPWISANSHEDALEKGRKLLPHAVRVAAI